LRLYPPGNCDGEAAYSNADAAVTPHMRHTDAAATRQPRGGCAPHALHPRAGHAPATRQLSLENDV